MTTSSVQIFKDQGFFILCSPEFSYSVDGTILYPPFVARDTYIDGKPQPQRLTYLMVFAGWQYEVTLGDPL